MWVEFLVDFYAIELILEWQARNMLNNNVYFIEWSHHYKYSTAIISYAKENPKLT